MDLNTMQEGIRRAAAEHLPPSLCGDERKVARIALCAAVKLFASCHQTRADAHKCLDHAFDSAGGDGVLETLAKMEAALALVGNAEGVSLDASLSCVAREVPWGEWRDA